MNAWDLYKTPKDRREAVALVQQLEALAAEGNGAACAVLGLTFVEALRDRAGKVVVAADARRARAFLERGVALKDRDSMLVLADQLSNGGTRSRAFARAARLYRRAYKLGARFAAVNLASCYQNDGRFREAVRWYRRAAAAGDEDAHFKIAQAELYGLGTRRNSRAAFARLRKLARSRVDYTPNSWMQAEAMLLMARALIRGWPVRRDFTAGVEWLRRAAALGHPPARAELEFMTGESHDVSFPRA